MTTSLNTTVQAAVYGMMTAMTVSVFASAIGIMIAATPMAAIPRETKATKKGLTSLREAFGASVVDRAVKEVGTDDVVALAMKVEELVRADMVKDYGEWATNTALESCPPGDLRCAKDVAKTLHLQGATPVTPTGKVETLAESAKKRVKAKAKPVVDTKTKVRYKSESAAGRAVAVEYGFDPDDHFVWYKIIKQDPDRFKPA